MVKLAFDQDGADSFGGLFKPVEGFVLICCQLDIARDNQQALTNS
jgi:hypothetical protein